MKKILFFITLAFVINLTCSCASNKKSSKHPSHKQAKKSKSKYFFNFQH